MWSLIYYFQLISFRPFSDSCFLFICTDFYMYISWKILPMLLNKLKICLTNFWICLLWPHIKSGFYYLHFLIFLMKWKDCNCSTHMQTWQCCSGDWLANPTKQDTGVVLSIWEHRGEGVKASWMQGKYLIISVPSLPYLKSFSTC